MSACKGVEMLKSRAREEGREEGRQEVIIKGIKSLMENLGLTYVQAMDALQIPEEERDKYRTML